MPLLRRGHRDVLGEMTMRWVFWVAVALIFLAGLVLALKGY
jgi:hypothetical protein